MPNIVALRERMTKTQAHIDELMAAGNTDDARVESGRLEAYRDAYNAAVDDVVAENDRIATAQHDVATVTGSIGARALGPRDQFHGLSIGDRISVPIRDAATTLATPQIYRTDLPGIVSQPMGFLATLLHGTTDGDEHFFKQPSFTNAADTWTTGDKPESAIAWDESTASLETIAHWIPIKRQTANRYAQLESLTNGALMLGLDQKSDYKALRGSNSSGIVGVCNTLGIDAYTKASGVSVMDAILEMQMKVELNCGYAANCVALSPKAYLALLTAKKTDTDYIFWNPVNGAPFLSFNGLTVVKDVNMAVTADSVTKQTALVYYSGGASWDVADPAAVTIGLTGNQFIQNAYTLLGETTAALRVDIPGAFSYCADLGM